MANAQSNPKAGWEVKPLGEVCEFRNGLWKGKKPPYVHVGVIRNTNFTKAGCLDDTDIAYLDVEQKQFKKRRLEYGDIILEKSGGGPKQPVGRVITFEKTQGEFSFSNFTSVIRIIDSSAISFKFLHRFLYWNYVSGVTEGMQRRSTGIRNLDFTAYKQIPVPLPPLPEQERIVGILDEAFEGIAAATAQAEKNLHNARELFQSVLQSTFSQKGDDWEEKRLDQACIVERGSSPRPIKQYLTTAEDGVNWIKIGDTKEGGKYVHSTAQKITQEGAKRSRFVEVGDFILTNSMSFGRPYIMKINGYIHDGWFVLRLNEGIDTDYFYYLFSSALVQDQFHRLAAGAVVKNISGDLVKQAVLPLPPLPTQQAIVEKLDALSEETKALEAIYERKQSALAELKQSLLRKAFAGEL